MECSSNRRFYLFIYQLEYQSIKTTSSAVHKERYALGIFPSFERCSGMNVFFAAEVKAVSVLVADISAAEVFFGGVMDSEFKSVVSFFCSLRGPLLLTFTLKSEFSQNLSSYSSGHIKFLAL